METFTPQDLPALERHARRKALAARFEQVWRVFDGPPYVTEYVFHPTRKWRFDYCWPEVKVALELEGGLYSGGRHTRARGYLEDVEKYNEATMLGWRVVRLGTGFAPQQVENLALWLKGLLRDSPHKTRKDP